jgi:hypothetical protein
MSYSYKEFSDIIEKAKHEYEENLAPITELMDRSFQKNEDLEEVKKLVPKKFLLLLKTLIWHLRIGLSNKFVRNAGLSRTIQHSSSKQA